MQEQATQEQIDRIGKFINKKVKIDAAHSQGIEDLGPYTMEVETTEDQYRFRMRWENHPDYKVNIAMDRNTIAMVAELSKQSTQ